MTPSKYATDLIKQCEQFKANPYMCPAGRPTIGYGTTRYPTGKNVTLQDAPVTQSQAISFLMCDLINVSRDIKSLVKSELTQFQFDALCSFVYNVGIQNFKDSTLLKKINKNPDDFSINDEFHKWIYATRNGQKVKLKGLIARRILESDLYFS